MKNYLPNRLIANLALYLLRRWIARNEHKRHNRYDIPALAQDGCHSCMKALFVW